MATYTPDYADLDPEPLDLPDGGTGEALESQQEEGKDPTNLTEDQKSRIIKICRDLDINDQPERQRWLPIWRKLEYLWSGWQKTTWDPIARDWRTPFDLLQMGRYDLVSPEDLYRNVNVYRAQGESIIAALSAALPQVRFFPDDADDPEDITTSRAFSKIAEKINIENDSPLTFIHALYILFNQSFVGFYNYYVRDKKYGTAKIPQVGMEEQEVINGFCPSCQQPTEEPNCPECVDESGQPVPTDYDVTTEYAPAINGYSEVDKGTEVIEAWGPLNLKILHGAKKQSDTPYVRLETDCHELILFSIYPELKEKLQKTAPQDPNRFDRTSVYNPDLHNVARVWLRPCCFETEGNEDLKELFPEGCYVVLIDESLVVESLQEKLDDCWTIPANPLARLVHADPMGLQVSHVQEMINELVDLTMQSIEQGVDQVFADPRVLDFTQYGNSEIKPGTVYPAKALANKSLGESFFTLKAATIGQGIEYFRSALDQYAQLTSGAFPSIYGGALQGGSNTYKEYEASKNQALQRLSLTWRMLNQGWAEVMRKSVTSYKNNLIEDDKFVKKFGNSYVSVHIKRSELTGKIGRVTAEVTDQLPVSWTQKRGVVLELLQMQLPQLIATFFHPENVTTMKDLFGLSDLYIPGEDDRIRQLFDILEMLNSPPMEVAPAMMNPATGEQLPPQMQSTKPPNPDLDDNEVRIQVLKAWLLSEVGEDAKLTNPEGYENVMQNLRERVQLQEMQLMQQAQQMGPVEGLGDSTKGQNSPSDTFPPEQK